MALVQPPVARAQMLIRRPVADVWAAFVDPAITTRFWFSHSSGPLTPGAQVRWDWALYGASTEVTVRDADPEARLEIAWGDPARRVEWLFTPRPDGTTLVRITEQGFAGGDDEQVAQALDAQGGFTNLLAGAKAWLEHGLALGLVGDQHPDAHVSAGG